jgi:ABC-2 type transport system permease protein
MKDMGLILTASIRNNLRSKVLNIVVLSVVILCVIGLAITFCLVLIAPSMNSAEPDKADLTSYLSMIMCVTCLLGLGVNMNASAFQTMTREKSRGNIESLLATPVQPEGIWIAKSLAVFLPGLVIGEIFTLIVLLVINYVYFVPEIGFLINPWMVISNFIALPLVYLGLSLLVHLIGLTGKPANGNVIVQIFLPVFVALIINLIVRSALDAGSWTFTLIIFGLAAVLGIIIRLLYSRLAKERIVLSR